MKTKSILTKLTWRRAAYLGLAFLALSQWSEAAWIYSKAQVAQWMIAQAWQQSLDEGQAIKPWSWADTWPVAKLEWHSASDKQHKTLYVLAGTHGEALAFGPGMMQTGLSTNASAALAGHRDTHFKFLQDVEPYDRFSMQTLDGHWQSYQVDYTEIRHIERDPLVLNEDTQQLLLITCYPFNALQPGGPLRYLVSASPIDNTLPADEGQQPVVQRPFAQPFFRQELAQKLSF